MTMVRVELQEQPTQNIESAKTSHVQSEAVNLLSSNRLASDASKNNSMNNGVVDFGGENIYGDKFNRLPEKPSDSCSLVKPACQGRDFRPDSQLRTRQGREWHGRSQEQRQKPLDLDKDGNYQVKRGDSLWTIAERMETGKDGRKPSAKTILDAVKRLTQANPQLCNPDFLKEGTTLKIPSRERPVDGGAQSSSTKAQDARRDSSSQGERRPDAPRLRLDPQGVLRGRPGGVTDGGNGNKPGRSTDAGTLRPPADVQGRTNQGNSKVETNKTAPKQNFITNFPPEQGPPKKPDACVEVKPAPMPQIKIPESAWLKPAPMPVLPNIENPRVKPAPMPVIREQEAQCMLPIKK